MISKFIRSLSRQFGCWIVLQKVIIYKGHAHGGARA